MGKPSGCDGCGRGKGTAVRVNTDVGVTMDDDLEDQLRDELLMHVAHCDWRATPDPVTNRTRWDTNGVHACEHVANRITNREHFHAEVFPDPAAVDGYKLCCNDCDDAAQRVGAVSAERWLVCDTCRSEFSLKDGWSSIGHLAPRHHETFRVWWARVHTALDGLPSDVAEQWLHRHWGHSPYEWLDIRNIEFIRETWTLGQVLAVGAGSAGERRALGAEPLPLDTIWLGPEMRKRGTWPRPIIVLMNASDLRSDLHATQLLEGHRRLAFLRTLAAGGHAAPIHHVWCCRIRRRTSSG